MTTAQEKAIARSADHENLVGELVEKLRAAANYIDVLGGDSRNYREVIAKAEAQQ